MYMTFNIVDDQREIDCSLKSSQSLVRTHKAFEKINKKDISSIPPRSCFVSILVTHLVCLRSIRSVRIHFTFACIWCNRTEYESFIIFNCSVI